MLSYLLLLSFGFNPILNEIKTMIAQEFPFIHPFFFLYDNFESVTTFLGEHQESYDSVFFADSVLYQYAMTRVRQLTHWSVFPRSSNNILRAIAEISIHGIDIRQLSIDSYPDSVIWEAYRGIDIPIENLHLQIYNDIENEFYYQNALQNHLKNLKDGTASGCITASTYVVAELKKRGLPYASAIPTVDTIRNVLVNATQYHQAQKNASAQIAVIYININFPEEYSLLLSDEYSFMLQKMSITKEIYKYADRISASVAEESIYNFILFSTCGSLEMETDHFRKFELLNWLHRVTAYSISIGVGNGKTAISARHNAFRAMLRAKQHSENVAYVIMDDGKLEGPYRCTEEELTLDNFSDWLMCATKQTGLSSNTLYRLTEWVQKNKTEYFTSKELADGLGLSIRSADRMLEKLFSANLAVLADAQMTGVRGRPTRIIRLRLSHPSE